MVGCGSLVSVTVARLRQMSVLPKETVVDPADLTDSLTGRTAKGGEVRPWSRSLLCSPLVLSRRSRQLTMLEGLQTLGDTVQALNRVIASFPSKHSTCGQKQPSLGALSYPCEPVSSGL